MSDKPNESSKTIAETTAETMEKIDSLGCSTNKEIKTATTRKGTARTSRAKVKSEKKTSADLNIDTKSLCKKNNDDENKKMNIDSKKIDKEPLKTEKVEKKTELTKGSAKTKKTTAKTRTTRKSTKTPKSSESINVDNDNTENSKIKLDDIKTEKVVNETIKINNQGEELLENKNNKLKVKSKKEFPCEKEIIEENDKSNLDDTEITSFNEALFHQGKNYSAYNILGSHVVIRNDIKGVQFATWAPRANKVYVVGDFNDFKVNEDYKLERTSENGIWFGFFTEPKEGDKYKYCIVDSNGNSGEYKSDPYAIFSEIRTDNASIIYMPKEFTWNDKKWMESRNGVNVLEQPLNIYEIHLGSWRRNQDKEFLSYEEISEVLPKYLKEMGYSHVEIMPLVEHPLDASWGYQGTGYYSPTSRYGTPEGLKLLIDRLHEANIGVIMDWVPGHFCKDAHGLYKFDGTATYEYQEEWRAENRGWGTCNFDLGRAEVRSYLISNALYWFREFHIDGLRVDAVSSILYLDYSRKPGEWQPNKYGGNGNLEAIDFLKELNQAVFAEYPTALMIAEESTAWPNITKPPMKDGLGFNLKWNMGWMNDTLEYVEIDPLYRKNNHRNITFAMMYNYAENYVLPLSHDEVVHGKKSLIEKMWGDEWNKYAGLRAFMGYMMGHPGKKLTFMGCEFAQGIEWREYEELEWNLIEALEINKKTQLFYKDLNNLYLDNKAFWELDHDHRGFNWIEADNNEQSILVFARRSRDDNETLIFIVNFTSIVYYDYKIGVPFLGEYEELFNTDDAKYGGSGQVMDTSLFAEKSQFQNQPYSLKIKVPPMATLVLKVKNIFKNEEINEQMNEELN